MTIPGCPILEDLEQIQDSSLDLVRGFRKLRRDFRDCKRCPQVGDCPVRLEFNAQVQNIVQQINDEWDSNVQTFEGLNV